MNRFDILKKKNKNRTIYSFLVFVDQLWCRIYFVGCFIICFLIVYFLFYLILERVYGAWTLIELNQIE